MPETLTLSQLGSAVRDAAAIRTVTRLQPAGGEGDKLFPPTYAVSDRADTKYAFEERRIGGETVKCVLIDSVASQANRMEEALRNAWERGELEVPVISVDFSGQPGLEDIDRITVFDAPHRIADAILRDSLLEGTLFRFSEPGVALTRAAPRNAGPLYHWCPMALVFGVWDSTGPRGGLGSKFARAIVSEVVGVNAVPGVATASRIDPVGIEIKAATLYESKDSKEMWTYHEDEAVIEKKKPKKYGRTKKDSGKPSAVNHGNVAPSLEDRAGGVTVDYALQTSVLSLTALRRLSFPVDVKGESIPRDQRANVEDAARTALAALGLAAMVLARHEGYYFRSRCHLVPEGPQILEVIGRDGTPEGRFTLTPQQARDLVRQAAAAADEHGLTWEQEEVKLEPTPKLVHLVKRSRALVAAGEAEEAVEA